MVERVMLPGPEDSMRPLFWMGAVKSRLPERPRMKPVVARLMGAAMVLSDVPAVFSSSPFRVMVVVDVMPESLVI
jgi:hypothetical protein